MKPTRTQRTILFTAFFSVLLLNLTYGQDTYIDDFNSISYSNNDGTANFSTDWIEVNDGATSDPSGGRIVCNTSGALGHLRLTNLDAAYIQRNLDLSGAGTVTFTIEYDANNARGEILYLFFYNASTSSWEYHSDVNSGNTSGSKTITLSGNLLSSASGVRLAGDGNWRSNSSILIDRVEFSASAPIDPCTDLSGLDSDGDGINDICDLDDDNDGIFDATENVSCSSPNNQIIFFQGFESGVYTGDLGNGVIMSGADLSLYDMPNGTPGQIGSAPPSGWGFCDPGEQNCEGSIVSYPFNFSCGGAANNTITGNNGVFLNSCSGQPNDDFNGNGIVGEAFSFDNIFLSINETYHFSFNLINVFAATGSYTFTAEVYDSNNVLVTSANIPIDATVVGTVIQGTGSFSTATDGIYRLVVRLPYTGVGADFLVDDFLLTQRICDTDGDGTPDYLELDSDNDGCSDVAEAGFTDADADGELDGTGYNADGTVSGSDGYTTPADADSNGTYDFQEAGLAPSITTQPTDVSICPGCSTSISTTIANADTYQWQIFNGTVWVDLVDTGIHSNTDTDTLTITNATPSDNGNQYRVIASSTVYVCDSETSNIATLTVNVNTVITNRRITYRIKKN